MKFDTPSRKLFRYCAFGLGLLMLVPAALAPRGGGLQAAQVSSDQETVILLHGMWRNARAMNRLEAGLRAAGYRTVNVSYPSTDFGIEELAVRFLHPAVERVIGGRVHFVTHSMGGILARYYLETHPVKNLGRVVMLAPPNQGVEMADRYGHWSVVRWATGPAGRQLGTGDASLPRALGPVDFDLGVIAGTKGRNIFSCMIPGQDDGLVSVESTKVAGMRDFLVLDQNHYWLKRDETAIQETIHFLKDGSFSHADEVAGK